MRWLWVLLLATAAHAQTPFRATRFTHERHAVRSGEKACATCHAGDRKAPVPKAVCAGCHDGNRAFSVDGTACRRCHLPPPTSLVASLPTLPAPRPFDHRRDAHQRPCAACHTLDAAGAPRAPSVGIIDTRARPLARAVWAGAARVTARSEHLPCAEAGCHAAEFRDPAPGVCATCHVGTEPWRPLAADAGRQVRTQFGARFPHARHDVRDCAGCHTGIRGGPAMRVGAGHASCSTSTCHTDVSTCSTCHVAGLLATRDERRTSEPWSAARRFRHDTHEATACTDCHRGVAASQDSATIPPPTKPTCLPCHDGTKAFKMTGHTCSRCHGPAR